MMHCLYTQNISVTQEQKDKIKEIFTPEYIIESSKPISITKIQDSVIKARDIQIKELQDKIEKLKALHLKTLVDIAKQNNIAKDTSTKIDSINDKQFSKLKLNWNGLHLYGSGSIPKIEYREPTFELELMYEFKKIHFGIIGQTEPIPIEPTKYQFNYQFKLRYKFF